MNYKLSDVYINGFSCSLGPKNEHIDGNASKPCMSKMFKNHKKIPASKQTNFGKYVN